MSTSFNVFDDCLTEGNIHRDRQAILSNQQIELEVMNGSVLLLFDSPGGFVDPPGWVEAAEFSTETLTVYSVNLRMVEVGLGNDSISYIGPVG